MRKFPYQNYISHHMGGYSLMWMQNTAHWEPGGCYSSLLCSSLHQNTQTHTLVIKSLKLTRRIHFMSTKKLIHFDLRSTPAHTGYTQWLLSIPYSVKLLPSLKWTASFRNTRNHRIQRSNSNWTTANIESSGQEQAHLSSGSLTHVHSHTQYLTFCINILQK
jgi:hypothetical protein